MDNIGKTVKTLKKRRMPVVRFLSLGYLITISIGTILLMLPWATKANTYQEITCIKDFFNLLINTLLTATSATCVTGLVTYDTFLHWTMFGQIVLIVLIQIGGLGFMTIITLIFMILRKNIGLYERTVLMQSAGSYSISDVLHLMKVILIGTFLIEAFGAAGIALRLIKAYSFSTGNGIYFGIFHSISAFCNAGFDLMSSINGIGFTSLSPFVSDPIINLIIIVLIVLGGLGFIIWSDILHCGIHVKRYQLHTKLVLVFNGLIFLISAIMYFAFEYSSSSMEGLNFGQKVLASLFMGVTPRTAGFNSIDLTKLTPSSKLLTIILMFIGGNSGSTAGGVKVTTIIVVFANLIAEAKSQDQIVMFKRRISNKLVHQASSLFIAYLIVILIATTAICTIERGGAINFEFEDILFEVVSAVGTVGLGMLNLTETTMATRIILLILMYIGRIGAFTLFSVFLKDQKSALLRAPEGNLMVG